MTNKKSALEQLRENNELHKGGKSFTACAIQELAERVQASEAKLEALEHDHKVLYYATKKVTGELGKDLSELAQVTAGAFQDLLNDARTIELPDDTFEVLFRVCRFDLNFNQHEYNDVIFGSNGEIVIGSVTFIRAKKENK